MSNQKKIEFIDALIGADKAAKAFSDLQNSKRAAVETLFEGLTDERRDRIREGMEFRVANAKGRKKDSSFSKKGQEHAVDTFGALKKGHGLRSKDQPKVQATMDELVKLTRQALDRKKPDGSPLFTRNEEIEAEIFTPLVRQGILPENFVLDQFSEVQRLLDSTFKNYRETLQGITDEKKSAAAKTDMDFWGAGSKIDTLKALGGKAKQRAEIAKGQLHLTDDKIRRAKIGVEFIKLGVAVGKLGKNAKGWTTMEDGRPKAVASADKMLNPEKYKHTLKGSYAELSDPTDSDEIRWAMAQQKREETFTDTLGSVGAKLAPLGLSEKQMEAVGSKIAGFLDSTEDTKPSLVKDGIKTSLGTIKNLVELGLDSKTMHEIRTAVGDAHQETHIRNAASDVIDDLDDALVSALNAIQSDIGDMIEGLFADKVNVQAVAAAAAPDPNASEIVNLIAKGFEKALTDAAPSGKAAAEAFKEVGKKLAKDFRSKAPTTDLDKVLKSEDGDYPAAFAGLVKVVPGIVKGAATEDFKSAVRDPETLRAMAARTAVPDGEEFLDEMLRSDEELREYERMLVLIDEGGVSAAEQRTIDHLIQQLKRDKQVMDLILKSAGVLTGAAGGAVNMAATASKEVTTLLAGQVTGALKAAQLIIKLGVNAKKAADRWALWNKFRKNVKRSKIAVSSLSSTIQGFFDNKKEQITFRTIEDVLTAIQIAAAVLETIPNEYTIAIGKTLSAAASAAEQANKVSEMVYNEKKLSDAWATTKAAMDSPRDRALGLKALRLNPTLGMHAIAWAATEKQPPDPIARMLMNDLGVDEQTMAVSGTENKVREYLVTLLHEDRSLLDPSKINTDWAPDSFNLTTKDWFVITSRGQREAVPKLRKGDEKKVLQCLKKTDSHDVSKLKKTAESGDIKSLEITRMISEAESLCGALRNYVAYTQDGAPHVDMINIADDFAVLANKHLKELQQVAEDNMKVQLGKEDHVINELDGYAKDLKTVYENGDEEQGQEITGAALTYLLSIRSSQLAEESERVSTAIKGLENVLAG